MSRENNDIFANQQNDSSVKQQVQNNATGDLDWSVPIESVPLPSNGAIYNPNSFFYNKETIDIKAMTAKEEDILLSSAHRKRGDVTSAIIKSCIGVPGVDPDELIYGDKNALMMAIRITGYGSDYKTTIQCPVCGHAADTVIDLSELEIIRLSAKPVQPGKNAFEYVLPVSKKKVIFKILSGKEEKEKELEAKRISEMLGENAVGAVTTALINSVVSIDGVTDPGKIKAFITNMPARDSRSLRSYIGEIQPGLQNDIEHVCPSCNNQSTVRLPITRQFFYPD
jgi:predicted RNA-binding Zn-ribbon protein involved in translation (DUF1610 family)